MKTPVTYYGGKQQMLRHILPLIPKHNLYCEPFAGGAAVYFAKEPAPVEVINDTNKEVVNFYEILKTNFKALNKLIQATLHSRKQHKEAEVIYKHPDMFDKVKRAWAFYVLSSQSFLSKMDGSWGYERKTNKVTKKAINKKKLFVDELAARLENTQIECRNAIKVIESRDCEEAFHYIDPPYFNSDMGHYKGYTEDDFKRLLETLTNLKGRFLLSSYPSDILSEFIEKNDWKTKNFDKALSAANRTKKRRKTEVLTTNYSI